MINPDKEIYEFCDDVNKKICEMDIKYNFYNGEEIEIFINKNMIDLEALLKKSNNYKMFKILITNIMRIHHDRIETIFETNKIKLIFYYQVSNYLINGSNGYSRYVLNLIVNFIPLQTKNARNKI